MPNLTEFSVYFVAGNTYSERPPTRLAECLHRTAGTNTVTLLLRQRPFLALFSRMFRRVHASRARRYIRRRGFRSFDGPLLIRLGKRSRAFVHATMLFVLVAASVSLVVSFCEAGYVRQPEVNDNDLCAERYVRKLNRMCTAPGQRWPCFNGSRLEDGR